MKVLWVVERFPPDRGGLAVSAARQVDALAGSLDRIDVVRLDRRLPAGVVDLDERGSLSVYRVGRAPEADESLQLLERTALNLAGRHRHDLVHGFGAVPAGYVATLVARLAGLPSVVSLRGNDVDRAMFDGARLAFLTWTLERAGALVSVTEELLGRVRALTGRERGLHRVPNGVDAAVFRPDAAPSDEVQALAGAPRPWIAFAGELRLKKGLPVLLDLARLLDTTGWGTLVLIGGVRSDAGDELARWRRQAGAASSRVREVAYVTDPKRLAGTYAAMDLFVFPSLWDGLPNALLQAMASARPVVATAVGGSPDVVRDGETGVLVPADRLGELPRIVLEVLDRRPEELRALGACARRQIARDFTVEVERDRMLAVYRSLLA